MKFYEAKHSNTSELIKLHHLSNFHGGGCPELPYSQKNFKTKFMQAHCTVRSYGPKLYLSQ